MMLFKKKNDILNSYFDINKNFIFFIIEKVSNSKLNL